MEQPGSQTPYCDFVHDGFHARHPSACCLDYAAGAMATDPAAEPTLASIDTRIDCLAAMMNNLNNIRLDQIRLRNQHIPIARLPPEVLQEIFLACGEPNLQTLPSNTIMPVALRIAHVSTVWRAFAFKLPGLWVTIDLHVGDITKSKTLAELLLQWLKRSKAYPLTIRLSFQDDSAWSMHSAPFDIIDTLMRFSEKWRDVSLTLPPEWQMKLDAIKGKLNCLETLHIRPPQGFMTGIALDAFSDCPQLSFVGIERIYLDSLQLPWTNLTKASIRETSLEDVCLFLSQCPWIEEYLIINPILDLGTPQNINLVLHERLKDLSIILGMGSVQHQFLLLEVIDLLVVPALERLTTLISGQDTPLETISSLIHRSGCPLALVEIYGPTIEENELTSFLSEMEPVLHVDNNPNHVLTTPGFLTLRS